MNNTLSIFISFSSKEKEMMLKINDFIESLGYKTYFAPRDIPFGTAYPNAIIDLINRSDIFLLIFSDSSQNSIWVQKELERAISKEKYVIPLKIEDVSLNGYMEFLISNTQWIDAHDQLFEHSATKFQKYLETLSMKFGKTATAKAKPKKEIQNEAVEKTSKKDKSIETLDLYQQGKMMYDKKDYNEAFMLFLQSANEGRVEAQNDLAYMYQEGLGVNRNYKTAMKWYTKAADQGYGESIKNLGRMFHNSYGVEPDYEKALFYYTKACESNNAHAMNNIGVLHQNGEGLKKNIDKAIEWFNKSAEHKCGLAYYNLGRINELGNDIEQDYEKAFEYYLQGYHLKHPYCTIQLGIMYELGKGVKQDYKKAMDWYQKAIPMDNGYALCNIGELYEKGKGVQQNYEEAMEYYKRAAAFEYAGSIKKIGAMYSYGKGVEVDHALAFQWYEKATTWGELNTVAELVVTIYNELVENELESADDKNKLLSLVDQSISLLEKSTLIELDKFKEYEAFCKIYQIKLKVAIALDNTFLAKKTYEEIQNKFSERVTKYDFDIYLHFAFYNSSDIYGKFLVDKEKYNKAIPILELSSKYSIKSSTELLAKIYQEGLGVEKDIEKADELGKLSRKQSMKKFKIPCDFNGTMIPFDLYVKQNHDDFPYEGIEDQVIWLKKARGGTVPDEVRDSFRKLHKIAKENQVSYPELCMYALEKGQE